MLLFSLGIVEDVPVKVGIFFVLGDSIVMEMEKDKEVPIILGRPFLRTVGVIVYIREGTLMVRVRDERIQF
jgi:hypothetical protein